jgi:hypothetical protein
LREEGARNIAAVVDLFLCFIKKLLRWCVYYELARAFSSSIAAYLFHVRFWTLARLVVCGTEFWMVCQIISCLPLDMGAYMYTRLGLDEYFACTSLLVVTHLFRNMANSQTCMSLIVFAMLVWGTTKRKAWCMVYD